MASSFHVQRPYVLTVLSSPLERPDGPGRYSIGEVFGQQSGSKKRKRSELTVGIDGDAASLYDISSSNLVTSYPIPPQSFFTCAPHSLRWKAFGSKDVTRYTYISTEDTLSRKKQITVFKDVLSGSGDTASTIVYRTHQHDSPIIHLSTTSSDFNSEDLGNRTLQTSLIAMTKDGTTACFHAETLEEQWTIGRSILFRSLPSSAVACQVDYVQAGLAADLTNSMFSQESDLFSLLSQKVHRDSFNPDILVAITSVRTSDSDVQRSLQVLVLTTDNKSPDLKQHGLLPIWSSPIPSDTLSSNIPSDYRLDLRLGLLHDLRDSTLFTYNLAGGFVRLESSLHVPGMTSFLRLSKSSVLASTSSSLDIYNPAYRALQATTVLDPPNPTTDHSLPYKETDPCRLVTYFGSLEMAVGVRGSALITLQIEPPKSRTKKRRAEGLLIDSIGRGLPRVQQVSTRADTEVSKIFLNQLPGSVSDTYWAEWQEDVAKANGLLESGEVVAFEALLAEKFGIELLEKAATNGAMPADSRAWPEWLWPSVRADYPRVDRRWVLYTISKVFAWDDKADGNAGKPHLSCHRSDGSLVSYLVDAGHLTLSNIKSAFKDAALDVEQVDALLATELPVLLSIIDPTLGLLLSYLSGTDLGAAELLNSIRLIMGSLDLVQDPARIHEAITNGEAGADDDLYRMELDKAQQELVTMEFYAKNVDARATGLSVAFSKLGACAAPVTVKAIRRLFKPEETLSLINILRMELVKDGWTTRYLDAAPMDDEESEAPPDGSIKLIADLLCRCIDAIGSSGFLANGALFAALTSYPDVDDFLEQFKAEVSVALEGIEEAVRLRGILTEVVKYGATMVKGYGQQRSKALAVHKAKPPTLESFTTEMRMLPLGLKSSAPRISPEKIVAGGEIVQRSKRETAMLSRKNLGPYVIERVGPKF